MNNRHTNGKNMLNDNEMASSTDTKTSSAIDTTTTTITTTPLIKYTNLLNTTTSTEDIETDTSITGNGSAMPVNGHYDVKAMMMMKNNNNNGFNGHNELHNDKRIQSSQLLHNNNKIDGADSITNSNDDDASQCRILMIGKTPIANVNDNNNHDDVVDDRLENISTKSLSLLNNFKNNAKQETDDGDLVVDGSKQEKNEMLVVNDSGNDDELICLLCNTAFDLSKHKPNLCKICALNVCLNCSLFDNNNNCWICVVCQQQR